MPDESQHTSSFLGFRSPNYTQVPDELFDELMATLSGAELKVLLYIIRRTFGFKKDSDNISLNQISRGISTNEGRIIDRGTGLSKSTVQVALKGLLEKKAVVAARRSSRERGNESTTYSLNLATPYTENRYRGGGPKTGIGLYRKSAPQETVVQDTDSSNIRTAAQAVDNLDPVDNGQTPATQHTQQQTTQPVQKPRRHDVTTSQQSNSSASTRREAQTQAIDASNGRSHGQNNGPEGLAAILSRHSLRPDEPDAREAIQSYIKDIAHEFGDKAKLRSSVTRAYNLYDQSGRTLHGFADAVFVARANVKERNDSTTQQPINNQMSYFFSVLADQLGLKAEEQADQQH